MVAKKPNWRHAKDYEFTESLDRAGWCWEFLRRNEKYQADYADMLSKSSDLHRATPHLRMGRDLVEYGPETLTTEEALGLEWGMIRAEDPDGSKVPIFSTSHPKELDWSVVRGYYESASDDAPVNTVSPFLIVAFDLTEDVDGQIEKMRDILESRRIDDKIHQNEKRMLSVWTTYLRLLDVGEGVATKEIRANIEEYQCIENVVETGYKGTDRVSDHKKVARSLRDNPLAIFRTKGKDLPK